MELPTDRILAGFRDVPESYDPDLRVLNLGAGVQSTTLLLMALDGEIERPDCAIFADTQWEPEPVYEHLEWLQERCEREDFPLHVVTAGNIREKTLAALEGERFASLPLHVYNEEGDPAMLRRQCTKEYKIQPIYKKVRSLLGLKKGARCPYVVEQWYGISTDEMGRMRTNHWKWIVNRYPLIEERMSRSGCKRWLRSRGYPEPPKSSCIGCPYHSNGIWRDYKENDPEAWEDAVEF